MSLKLMQCMYVYMHTCRYPPHLISAPTLPCKMKCLTTVSTNVDMAEDAENRLERGDKCRGVGTCNEARSILEVTREYYYENSSVLDCVTQCSQSTAHLYEQFLQVQQIGFVTLGPLCCV